jgi:hypothetical protein
MPYRERFVADTRHPVLLDWDGFVMNAVEVEPETIETVVGEHDMIPLVRGKFAIAAVSGQRAAEPYEQWSKSCFACCKWSKNLTMNKYKIPLPILILGALTTLMGLGAGVNAYLDGGSMLFPEVTFEGDILRMGYMLRGIWQMPKRAYDAQASIRGICQMPKRAYAAGSKLSHHF